MPLIDDQTAGGPVNLTDLHPKWFEHDNAILGFTFLCPHCQSIRLACALKPMPPGVHRQVFGEENQHYGHEVVGTKPTDVWSVNCQDFHMMSVTPSLDASQSGHWHGHITNGVIC